VPSTARAMREGALDFLVKPVDEPELLNALARA
jgi:FixJ family two-component response regulator